MYKSVPNKRGVYRWIKIRKSNIKKISLKSLKNMANRYNVTTKGTKKQVAKRLIILRGRVLKAKDINELKLILSN